MKYALSFLIILWFSDVISQPYLSNSLENHLQNTNQSEFVQVRIEMNEQFDAFAFNKRMNSISALQKSRVPVLLHELISIAQNTQANILAHIQSKQNKFRNINVFWIVNVIILEARADALSELLQFEEIKSISLENNRFLIHEEYKIELTHNEQNKAIDGVEPGILACNVRPLWDLGYTGRGRRVYIYDTGVWPTHPAYTDRFMGNFAPMHQAWYGYYNENPNGQRSSHGSHVLGTVGGLVEATNDTLGIAFNSYWMANDLVGPTVASLPELSHMMAAFEWALNPDGDISTIDDMPDVINNSWRWYDGADMEQCEGIVVNLMNVIEAAGIANLFAAGNFGPNNTTISAPQRINTSEVNTFSVGSVNGNLAFPHPISDFSSRGPKQCPGEGSLSIHPEVVAPGQNVRSAWNQNEYSTISGTSMATPHVSGVVLLLKEAFPNLTGEELLWALYLTAIDLGDPGEDNTYGMGLIDAHAAFQYLAMTHTPFDPNSITYDLAIIKIQNPDEASIHCESTFSTIVTLQNKGNEVITDLTLEYNLNGGLLLNQSWTGTLNPNETIDIQLNELVSSLTGNNELKVNATINNGIETYDLYNNTRYSRFNIRPTKELPFYEGFENGMNNGDWVVNNPDDNITWEIINVVNKEWGEKATVIKCFNYSPNQNQRDELISPFIDLPAGDDITLEFDVSYLRRSSSTTVQDTLRVLIKQDCGNIFVDTIAELYALDLAFSSTNFWGFTPSSPDEWRNFNFDLSHLQGERIALVFESTNKTGNNIYLDNVKVYTGEVAPLATLDKNLSDIELYPNPNNGVFTINMNGISFDSKSILQINNTTGQEVYSQKIVNNTLIINLEYLPKGMYIAHMNTVVGRKQFKIIIK